MRYGRNYLGLLGDDDELERRRQADQLGMLNASSPDAWIEQQANLNPEWMRRQPDMTFSTYEAEHAPDMTFDVDETPKVRPDMEISLAEAEANRPQPDMTFSLDETERDNPYVNRSTPVVTASAEAPPTTYRQEQFTQPDPSMPRGLGELGDRWTAAEHGALDQSGLLGDEGYGVGEGLRDFIPLAAGLGLDLAFNKGRGAGRVAAGGMQAISDEESRRDRKKAQRTNEAIAIRRARQDEANASERGQDRELGWANYAQREETNKRLAEMQKYKIDPNHPQAQAMLDFVKNQTGVDTSGLSTQQQGQVMPVAGRVQELTTAPLRQAGVTRADLDVKHELAPRTAQDLADQGVTVEEGTRGSRMRTLGAERDVKNPMLDDFGAPILPEGITDDGRYAQIAQRDPEKAQRYMNTLQDTTKLEKLNEQLIGIRRAVDAIDMRGRTRNNPEFAKLVGQWNDVEEAYQAELFRAQDRGAPQVYEDKRFQSRIGAPFAIEDVPGQPLAALQSALTDQSSMLQGRLDAIRGRRSEFINAVFGPQGKGGTGRPDSRAGAPLGPGQFEVPGDLGVAGGRSVRSTPDIPEQAPQETPGPRRAVRQADGTYEVEGGAGNYTESEIRKLIRKGAVRL